MKKEAMDKSFYLDGITWIEPKEPTEDSYWLDFLILDKEINYMGGREFITQGLLVEKEEMVEVVAMFNHCAELMGVPVAVYYSHVVRERQSKSFTEFGVDGMIMISEGRTLAYLNLDAIPKEYRTEEWNKAFMTQRILLHKK